MFPDGVRKPVWTIGDGTPVARAAATAARAFMPVFDTTTGVGQTETAMAGMTTGTFMTTPATGLIVVSIILPL
jgi:hypothetical protein